MSLKFPLDPDAVAAADAVVLPKNGGKPLTMESKDKELRDEWLKIYEGALKNRQINTEQSGNRSDPDPEQETQTCPRRIKRKNIIFIGSEMSYDSFWLKMMFVAPGYTTGKNQGPIRVADLTTVAYVAEGYTFLEKLPLDQLRAKYGCTVLKINSSVDIIAAMNDTPEIPDGDCVAQVKLQDVVFFSHGLPSAITLNYHGSTDVTLDRSNLAGVRSDVFVDDGTIWSYACRTGNASVNEFFTSDAGASPKDSLAQKMADRFKVTVYAFISRSSYGNVLRDPAYSDNIVSALKSQREGRETQVINLSEHHEALPHPGLAEHGTRWTGPIGEGTNGFALWRKEGARAMPIAGDTPSGLSRKLIEFKP